MITITSKQSKKEEKIRIVKHTGILINLYLKKTKSKIMLSENDSQQYGNTLPLCGLYVCIVVHTTRLLNKRG
jgi:hypothetical protein